MPVGEGGRAYPAPPTAPRPAPHRPSAPPTAPPRPAPPHPRHGRAAPAAVRPSLSTAAARGGPRRRPRCVRCGRRLQAAARHGTAWHGQHTSRCAHNTACYVRAQVHVRVRVQGRESPPAAHSHARQHSQMPKTARAAPPRPGCRRRSCPGSRMSCAYCPDELRALPAGVRRSRRRGGGMPSDSHPTITHLRSKTHHAWLPCMHTELIDSAPHPAHDVPCMRMTMITFSRRPCGPCMHLRSAGMGHGSSDESSISHRPGPHLRPACCPLARRPSCQRPQRACRGRRRC